MIYYTVYKITNTINNKIYVGFHKTSNLNDSYFGSGLLITKAIREYGKEHFSKEILAVFDNKEAAESYEAHIVDKEFTLREDTYNLALGGNVQILYGENNGFYGKHHSDETKNAQSIRMLGNSYSKCYPISNGDLTFQTASEFASYMNITKNIRNNVLLICGGSSDFKYIDSNKQQYAEQFTKDSIKRREEKSKLMSILAKERFTGYIWTDARNEKLSNALKGRKLSDEHINKVNRNPEKIRKTAEKHRGMKRSDETRMNISLAKIGKPPCNKGKIRIKDSVGNSILWDKNLPIPDGFKKLKLKKAINGSNSKMIDADTLLHEGWTWKH